ncbi:MAG: mechanosensitive ion channel [Alphaproteobacteria bacterium]|nr:mechanosensitive ion channel [Alphaproteobacteria bacterium]
MIRLAHVLMICVALCISVLPFQATAQTAQNGSAIAAGDAAIDDRAIETRIEEIFGELDGLQSVSVVVRSGVVTLGGIVAEVQLSDRAQALASRVDGVVAVTNEIEEETSVTERLVPVYERLENRTVQAFNYIPLVLVALLFWLVVGTAGFLTAALEWPWNRIAPNAFIADLIRQLVRILFVVVGGVLALDILGATALLGTLLGAAGIVGLAVGFAVRDTVENYIASILLSIRQPFRPKDYVAIEGYEGFVISLTSRATILMEPAGNHIRIPNATVFKSNIINYSTNPQRRFLFKVGVDADSDLNTALEIGLQTVSSQTFVLDDPAADAWIDDLGDSNVVLVFAGWIDQTETSYLKARSEAMRLVKRSLEASGFTLPEPIYRLRFDAHGLPGMPVTQDAVRQEPSGVDPEARARAESAEAKDTAADRELEKRVEEERDATGAGDLLDERAPNEFGGT